VIGFCPGLFYRIASICRRLDLFQSVCCTLSKIPRCLSDRPSLDTNCGAPTWSSRTLTRAFRSALRLPVAAPRGSVQPRFATAVQQARHSNRPLKQRDQFESGSAEMQSALNRFGASQEKESCQGFESLGSLSSINAPTKGKRKRANEREALRAGGERAVDGKVSSWVTEVSEGEAVGASKSVAKRQQEVNGGSPFAGWGASGPSVIETKVTEGGEDSEKTGGEGVAGAEVSSSLQEMEKAAKAEETGAGESEPEIRASTDLESFR
jgi:hypothetical protein